MALKHTFLVQRSTLSSSDRHRVHSPLLAEWMKCQLQRGKSVLKTFLTVQVISLGKSAEAKGKEYFPVATDNNWHFAITAMTSDFCVAAAGPWGALCGHSITLLLLLGHLVAGDTVEVDGHQILSEQEWCCPTPAGKWTQNVSLHQQLKATISHCMSASLSELQAGTTCQLHWLHLALHVCIFSLFGQNKVNLYYHKEARPVTCIPYQKYLCCSRHLSFPKEWVQSWMSLKEWAIGRAEQALEKFD